MVAVEVSNRSGVEVDEEAAVELARRVLGGGGRRGRRARPRIRRRRRRCAALKREHLGVDEATDVLSFPIDGRKELAPRACRASSATSCSARRSSARRGGRRSSTGCCTCSATTTAPRWRRREADGAHEPSAARRRSSRASTSPSRASSTCSARSGTCGSTSRSRWSCSSRRSRSASSKLELIALLLAIAFVLIAEMINSAIEQAIDVATTSFDPLAKLAKDIAAGAVLIATVNAVAIGYLVFSGRGRRPQLAAARPAARRAGRGDADRARPDDHRRDRDEGATPAGARRCAAGCPRATRRSPSPAGWPRPTSSATRAPLPDLVADVHHGAARGADAGRVGRPLGARGRLRRAARRARHPGRLPGSCWRSTRRVGELYERAVASPSAPTRRTRTTWSARRCAPATAASSRASTSRTPPIRSASAPRRSRSSRRGRRRAAGPATSRRSGSPPRPCGGCRQWLYEFRLDRVTFRNRDGELVPTRRPSCCRTRGSSTDVPKSSRSVTARAPDLYTSPPRAAGCYPTQGGGVGSEERLRRRRRAAERREVDARQRARRRQGGDRLGQAADDAPAHHGDRERRRLPARARRPARASSGRSTR